MRKIFTLILSTLTGLILTIRVRNQAGCQLAEYFDGKEPIAKRRDGSQDEWETPGKSRKG